MNNELDKALKTVMARRESRQDTPRLSPDFAQRVMSKIDSVEADKKCKPSRTVVLWRWTAIAATIALLCYMSATLFHDDEAPTPSTVVARKEPVKVVPEPVRESSFDITKSEVMPARIDTPLHDPSASHNASTISEPLPAESTIEPGFEWAASLLAGYDVKKEGRLRTVEAPKIRHDSPIEKPMTAERKTPQEIECELRQSLEQITRQGKELASIINKINENEQKQFTINNYRQ